MTQKCQLAMVLARGAFSGRQGRVRNWVSRLLEIWGHLIAAAINKQTLNERDNYLSDGSFPWERMGF